MATKVQPSDHLRTGIPDPDRDKRKGEPVVSLRGPPLKGAD
jgi:hypothetical protein